MHESPEWTPLQKGGDFRRKELLKRILRGTKLPFCGRGWKWYFTPKRYTNLLWWFSAVDLLRLDTLRDSKSAFFTPLKGTTSISVLSAWESPRTDLLTGLHTSVDSYFIDQCIYFHDRTACLLGVESSQSRICFPRRTWLNWIFCWCTTKFSALKCVEISKENLCLKHWIETQHLT